MFQLTTSQVRELIQAYAACDEGVLRTCYQAVRLYGTGHAVVEIGALTRCSRTSLMELEPRLQTSRLGGAARWSLGRQFGQTDAGTTR
ncbi:hypothetical protein MTYM_00607 [Methylococcales bacterium]|nr:hypothetical protein MTYM_00607 [Methylococcales bacterium]